MSVYEVHVVGNHTTTTLYSTHSVSVWYCVYVYNMYLQYIYTACVYSICTAVCVSTPLYYVHVCMSLTCVQCVYTIHIYSMCIQYMYYSIIMSVHNCTMSLTIVLVVLSSHSHCICQYQCGVSKRGHTHSDLYHYWRHCTLWLPHCTWWN